MEIFSVLAECAITLAGFSAIFAVLQGSTGPRGSMRAAVTFSASAVAFVVSTFPLLFELIQITETMLWRICSILATLCAISLTMFIRGMDKSLSARGFPPQRKHGARIGIAMVITATLFFIANCFPWPHTMGRFVYAGGALLLLAAPIHVIAFSFVLTLQETLSSKASASNDQG